MRLLLAGDDPVLHILQKQFNQASIESREMTGKGFFTYFAIPEKVQLLPGKPSFNIGDVEASIPSVRYGTAFLLWITDGALDFLEGYTYDDPWPDNITEFSISYIGGERNINEVQKAWRK